MTTKTLTPEQEYRQAEGINYSSLSALAVSPLYYKNKQDKEQGDTDAFIRGAAVDCLLTTPDDFADQFYVMTAKKPESAMMLAYVENYLETEDRNSAFLASGYKRPIPDSKWEEEGRPYYDAIKSSKGKRIMTFEVFSKVQAVVTVLQESKYTKKYFTPENDSIEIKFQYPIFWEHSISEDDSTIKCKSLLDIVLIDHANKKVFPIDIKTTGNSVYAFPSSFRKYKYYLQASFYTAALDYQMATTSLENYETMPFRFVVAEMDNINLPAVYVVSKEDLLVGSEGGKDNFGNQVKGWRQLIKELCYYTQHDSWDYPLDIVTNNGEIQLESFNT